MREDQGCHPVTLANQMRLGQRAVAELWGRVLRPSPLLALGLLVLALAALACGDDASEPVAQATATLEGATVVPTGAEPNEVSQDIVPRLTAPVSRFAVSQDDLPLGSYLTSIQNTFEISLEKAGRSDDVHDTIDYRRVHELVVTVGRSSSHHLLESYGLQLLDALFDEFDQAENVFVVVRKVTPVLDGVVDSVGVKLGRRRGNAS